MPDVLSAAVDCAKLAIPVSALCRESESRSCAPKAQPPSPRVSRLAQARCRLAPEFACNLLTVLVRGHSLSTLGLALLCGAQSGGGATGSWHSAGSLEQKDPNRSLSVETHRTQLTAAALVGKLQKKKKERKKMWGWGGLC